MNTADAAPNQLCYIGGALLLSVILVAFAGITGLILSGIIVAVGYAVLQTGVNKDVRRTALPGSQVIRQAVQEIGADRKWTATGPSVDFAVTQGLLGEAGGLPGGTEVAGEAS